jgi:hypothetical protein
VHITFQPTMDMTLLLLKELVKLLLSMMVYPFLVAARMLPTIVHGSAGCVSLDSGYVATCVGTALAITPIIHFTCRCSPKTQAAEPRTTSASLGHWLTLATAIALAIFCPEWFATRLVHGCVDCSVPYSWTNRGPDPLILRVHGCGRDGYGDGRPGESHDIYSPRLSDRCM